MTLPIRTRLTLWYAAVLTLIVVAIGVFLVWRLRADLIRGIDEALVTRTEQTTLALEDPEEPKEKLDVEDIQATDVEGISAGGSVTQILSPGGHLLGSAGDNVRGPLLGPDAVGSVRSPVALTRAVGDDEYRILASRLERSGALLVVGSSTRGVDDATRTLLLLLAIAVPAAIALSALGGYVLAGRALRPVDRMTRTAAAIGADDSSARLEVPAVDDEVGRLGVTLNAMLDRLHAAIAEQRRFTADASHELRTPLAIMQTEIDVALRSEQTPPESRPVLVSVAEELARTRRIVESLLTLARADEDRLVTSPRAVDMRDVARDVADRLAGTAAAEGAELSLEVDHQPAVVSGDVSRLDQLLSNLVENAIKYGDGTIGIRVANTGSHVLAEVADNGPGIPSDDVLHIFERFHRVDKARTRTSGGAGLGLAICRSIARAHDGDIEVRSTVGEGSVFTVRLPPRTTPL